MRALLLSSVVALAAADPVGAATVYRCAGATGVSFQEMPCEAGTTQATWEAPAFPPVNTAERERILQREAALDARLLKRAEIEAAERSAREARWAREAELEAERQRSRAAEGAYFYPVYPLYAPTVRSRPTFRPARPLQPPRY